MKNMLGKSTLQKLGGLLKDFGDKVSGPDGELWVNAFVPAFGKFLRESPSSAECPDPFRKEKRSWQKFYKSFFRIDADFSDVTVPKRPGPAKDWQLIIVAKGMTPQQLYNKCKELFPCWCWTNENLNEIVESERTTKDGHYAVWVRTRVEADEEFKNLSANDLKKQNHKGITLEERLALELHYFWKTRGKHLDIQNVTLCTGSRYSDGRVPRVDWHDDKLDVRWYDHGYADDARLRSRVAVS